MAKAKDKTKGTKPAAAPTVKPAARPAAVAASTPSKTAAPKTAPTPKTPTMTAIPAIAFPIVKGSTMNEQFQQFSQLFSPKSFDQFVGQAKEQADKVQAQSAKAFEDMAKFSKDNLDAVVSASTVYAKGFETFGKAFYALSQETVEASATVAKALLGAKTLKEAVDLQTDFAKTTFDKFVAESTKLSEMSIKVANEALEPINARVNVAVEKMLKPAVAA